MGAIQKKRALEHLYLSMWKSAYQTKEGARMKPLFTRADMEKAYDYGKNDAPIEEFRLLLFEIVRGRK